MMHGRIQFYYLGFSFVEFAICIWVSYNEAKATKERKKKNLSIFVLVWIDDDVPLVVFVEQSGRNVQARSRRGTP